jgi:hypothetical protein
MKMHVGLRTRELNTRTETHRNALQLHIPIEQHGNGQVGSGDGASSATVRDRRVDCAIAQIRRHPSLLVRARREERETDIEEPPRTLTAYPGLHRTVLLAVWVLMVGLFIMILSVFKRSVVAFASRGVVSATPAHKICFFVLGLIVFIKGILMLWAAIHA